ncbi:MAG TPA: hypothetical protein VEZ90_05650 [Blastocatellia bacterium]|nr:hypothetical protein [Blastocatellia bacterium]
MKKPKRSTVFLLRLLAGLALCLCVASAGEATRRGVQSQRVRATIDTRKTYAPISKYVYGQFLEHIGDIVNKGLWAEMVDDRKFFNAIVDKEPAPVPGRFSRPPLRRWTAVGPIDAVTMDSDHLFVGKQSPLIRLAGSEPHGIQQAGLTLVKNETYTGRVVLAGDAGAKVAVSLIWGPGEKDQTTTINSLGAAYKTYALAFQGANRQCGR